MTIYHPQELCRRNSFEEVAYLFWHGELPTRDQVSAQNRVERTRRALDPRVDAALARQPSAAHPVDTLRAALGVLGAGDRTVDDAAAAVHAKAVRLFAVLPSIVAADQRLRQGLGAITPRDHLGYAANFLSMIFGKVPEPQVVAAFETALILYAGHSRHAPPFPPAPPAPAPTRTGRPTPRSARSSARRTPGPARQSSRW